MRLIAVYVGLVLAGLLVAYGVGRVAETWSETVSLIVFLVMFFGTLWASWQVAIRIA